MPYIYTINGLAKQIYEHLEVNPHLLGSMVNFNWKSELCGDVKISLPVTSFTKYLFKYMIGENMSFREIFDATIAEVGEKVDDKLLIRSVKNTLTILQDAGALLLRNKNVPIW